jgi:SSS family solute:Na+ symporter
MANNIILWFIVAGYMTFIFVKGVLKAKKIKSSDDYLVAGRNIGWFALFCTMGATVIGGGASIGAIGRTYDWGVLMLLVSMGWYLHFIFSGLVVAPRFREAELYTVAGYFGHRFDEKSRFLVMVLSLLFSVFIVAAQMAAFGTVLSTIMPQVADITLVIRLSIIFGGLLVVIYSTAGGLLAVIHTDIYQFLILLGGFIVTMIFCLPYIMEHGVAISNMVSSNFFHPHGGKGWLFLITTFLAFFFGETFAPGYATRYCVGKNIEETKKGIAGVGFFLALIFPAILFVIALFAKLNFPNEIPFRMIEQQQALPMVIQVLNNSLIAGLIIGALLMAVMSSADSALNSATAIFVKDLFQHQLKWTHKSDAQILRLARICTVMLGLAAILIAVLWPNIIDLLLITYHLWAPAIILPVSIGAIYSKRSPKLNQNIFYAMVTALTLTMIYKAIPFFRDVFSLTLFDDSVYSFITTVDAAVFGVVVSFLTFSLFSLFNRGNHVYSPSE